MESTVKQYFNNVAFLRDGWKRKSSYYHQQVEELIKYLIPRGKKILEIGCGTGDLLATTQPSIGVGIDIAEKILRVARKKYPRLKFKVVDAEKISFQDKFDYIIMSDLIGNLEDVQKAFEELNKLGDEKTRIVITYYNFLWEPLLKLLEKIGLKMPQPEQNWLPTKDIRNLLFLSNIEIIKEGSIILLPFKLPLISVILNRFLARLPLLSRLCLVRFFVARKTPNSNKNKEHSVSVIIPARNEAGNIESAVSRTPLLGRSTELIFIEGHSSDNTIDEIERVKEKYKDKLITLVRQGKGVGKADAVRKGFNKARGEVLIILDADLTVAPEELPKFYHSLRVGKGELVIGSRLVYPMEKQAMRLLNIIGNKFFSVAFSFLLDQSITDTLCGTKAIFQEDYHEIVRNRKYFGDFDPFGDFDLIFGASKLNLKIIEIPIRYHARTYGSTNISRFKHGWLLLKMTFFAARKIKFV